MAQTTSGDQLDDLVGQVVEEFFKRVESGERPQMEEFIERYPEISDLLKTVIPALQTTDKWSRASNGPMNAEHHRQLGDFRLLRQIGRGGMGIVYEAEQISMKRRVALKVLPLAGLVDELKIRRFQNEVRAVAALDHPNIVSVYMVGEERGVHYFAMQLIRGRSLSEVISSLRHFHEGGASLDGESMSLATRIGGADSDAESSKVAERNLDEANEDAASSQQSADCQPVEPDVESSTIPHSSPREYYRSVVALGIQAATALQHAHEEGIIHRDVKPANLLLDGAAKLYLTDFGLARIESDAGVTMTGDFIGTLRYMAPEQALAKRVVVDHRADIYSLAVTLYELLTLRPTYIAEDRQQLLKQIAFEEPAPLRRIDRDIPKELETIVHKAMSKDMNQRYASAQDMADDLRSHLENRPIKAKPPTTTESIGKWTRRNPIITWATIITLSLVTMTLIASMLLISKQLVRATDAEAEAERDRQEADKQRRRAESGSYALGIRLATERLDQDDVMVARQDLLAAPSEFRNWEWGYLVGRAWPQQVKLDPVPRKPGVSTAEYWSAAPVNVIHRLEHGFHRRLNMVGLSNDGERIVSGLGDGTLRLWDFRTGNPLGDFPQHTSMITAGGFSNDAKLLAAGDVGGDVFLLDVSTKEKLWTDGLQGKKIQHFWFGPQNDDTRLVVVDSVGAIGVWETSSGRKIHMEPEHPDSVQSLRFLPDGESVITSSRNGSIRLWELETGRLIEPPGSVPPRDGIATTVINPKNLRQVAVGYVDGSVILWDRETDEKRDLFKGDDRINNLVFSQDGTCLILLEGEQLVRVLAIAGDQLIKITNPSDMQPGGPISLTADGTRIVTGSADGMMRVWAPVLSNRDERRMLADAHDDVVLQAAFSPNGQRIVTSSYDKTARVWDVASQELICTFDKHKNELLKAEFSPDGRYVASIDFQGIVHVWNAETGDEVSSVEADPETFFRSASSDGGLRGWIMNFSAVFSSSPFFDKRLVANYGKEMAVIDYTSGDPLLKLADNPRIGWPVISPNGNHVAVVTDGLKEIHLWNLETGDKLHVLPGHEKVAYWAEFSSDGSRLVTSSMAGTAIVWDVLTGQRLVTIPSGPDYTAAASFDPQGRRIATASADKTAKIWDASTAELLTTFDDHTSNLTNVEFSPDGTRVLTTSMDNTVRVWDPEESDAREFVQFTQDSKLVYGTWSPDGRRILTCWSDGSVHLLEAFPWEESSDDSVAMDERVRLWREGHSAR